MECFHFIQVGQGQGISDSSCTAQSYILQETILSDRRVPDSLSGIVEVEL